MTLLLLASPREDSLSSRLGRLFVREPTVVYNLYKTPLKPCMGCSYCEDVGACRFDDADKLFETLSLCDRLVIASPVYNYGFPAPVKAFLDRCQPFYFSPKEAEPGRRSFLLLTCGRSGRYAEEMTERQIGTVSEELGFVFSGSFVKAFTDKENSLSGEELRRLGEASESFYSD